MSEWNLSDPDQRSEAAAEYVLGLLNASDRARFEALLTISHDAQTDVQQWQEHFQVLNDSLEPVRPPSRLWKSIARKTRPASKKFWQSLHFWQGATASLACSLFLAVFYWLAPLPNSVSEPEYIYVVQGEKNQPEWIVNASMEAGYVSVKAVQPDNLPEDQVCELWLMVKGIEPVSLGILPKSGEYTVPIRPLWKDKLHESPLVITLEKPGGAPSGYEMGRVLNKGQWVPIGKSI